MPLDCDVLFALTGDVRRNSRALRQLRALTEEGYRVHALTLGQSSAADTGLPGVHLHVLPTPTVRGPLFFLKMHRIMTKRARTLSARVYHASDLFTLPAMARAASRHGASVVYDSRELYTALAPARRRPWVSWFWRAIERHFIRRADLILTVNNSIAGRLVELYDVGPPLVLPNVPAQVSTEPAGRLRELAHLPPDLPLFLYQGYLRKGRGCEALIAAATRVPSCAVVFLGEGPFRAELERKVAHAGLEPRVKFVDMVPPDALLPLTADADVGVCLTEDVSENHRLTLPNKLFEYLAAGLPVLVSPLPELEQIVRTYDVGRVAAPDDLAQTEEVIREMIDDRDARLRWSRNTRNVMADFDPAVISARFEEAYARLLGNR